MVFKDENNNIIEQKDVWKYEHIRADLDVVYFKTPSENYLRFLREKHCFAILNQNFVIDGQSASWFDTLTDEQKIEANDWVQAWRDVTKTKIIPDKPIWLK
jgi:hypothetical protein